VTNAVGIRQASLRLAADKRRYALGAFSFADRSRSSLNVVNGQAGSCSVTGHEHTEENDMTGLGPWLLKSVPASITIRLLAAVEYLRGEPEVRALRSLCDGRGFVDVGANRGVYSFVALKRSSVVTAFEPNEVMSGYLESWSRGRVNVQTVALSDVSGRAVLATPVKEGIEEDGLSTLNDQFSNWGTEVRTREVATVPLDELELGPVGFLKVDVEGHELEVLRGAHGTIERYNPMIQVECEERHRPGGVQELRKLLEGLGYQGFFVLGTSLAPIQDFDVSVHQRLSDVGNRWTYVNNFYFCCDSEQLQRLRTARFRPQI
jgi:FkbM family methyltransferase